MRTTLRSLQQQKYEQTERGKATALKYWTSEKGILQKEKNLKIFKERRQAWLKKYFYRKTIFLGSIPCFICNKKGGLRAAAISIFNRNDFIEWINNLEDED